MLTGSMTIAAEALQVSQPAISRLIRDLEIVLSLRLFRREGNRLIPGAEAQVLYAEVDKFYQGIERIERVAEDLVTLRTGTLRISSMSTLGLSVVAEGVCRFARKHPEVRTSLDVRNSVGILELTSANQIDIGFVQIPSGEYPGIQVINLPPISAVCVMPANDMLATKDVVTLEDLHGRRLITLNANNPLQRRITSAMEARGVAGVSSVETTAAHSACGMVSGGSASPCVIHSPPPTRNTRALRSDRWTRTYPSRFRWYFRVTSSAPSSPRISCRSWKVSSGRSLFP